MQTRLLRTFLFIFASLFVFPSYANQYCSIFSVEKIFHVTGEPKFWVLGNNEPTNMGFEDTCQPGSCYFHTCNEGGELKVTLGTSDWKKYCTLYIGFTEGFPVELSSYTCTINDQDAGPKMKVTFNPTGGGYYTIDIKDIKG